MSDTVESDVDWRTVPDATAKFIFDQGALFLQAQKDFMIASDQRSMSFAAIMTALATGALGVALLGESGNTTILMAAAFTAALVASLSAFCALMAARPGLFHYPAVRPGERLHLPVEWLTLPENVRLIGEAFAQQAQIDANGIVLSAVTGWYKRALVLAGITPALALVAALAMWAAGA